MANTLTKADAARKKAAKSGSLISALRNGGPMVWLSCLVMGLGNFAAGQYIKGLIFLLIEIAAIVFLVIPQGGAYWLSMLPSLGDRESGMEWSEEEGLYIPVIGDNSQEILLYAVATIAILAFVAIV